MFFICTWFLLKREMNFINFAEKMALKLKYIIQNQYTDKNHFLKMNYKKMIFPVAESHAKKIILFSMRSAFKKNSSRLYTIYSKNFINKMKIDFFNF